MSEKSGKLIAVWGSPHSGKTTFSAALGTAIADSYASATVIVLHSDIETPMLSVLFPNAKSGSLGSVGIPLSANEPDTEQILANCTETKARPTLAVLGYRDGDTRLTYPRYGKERAVELFEKLKSLSDFVIVDCMSNPNESLLSLAALETASQTIRLCTPELPGNARITAIKTPIVTDEVGIAASIRFLHPQEVDRKKLLTSGMVNEEMLTFLESCVRYGVSLVVAGRTSSGKTTLLNALLESIPNDKRIFGIESGAREFALVKLDCSGRVLNNVVLTLSRQAENGSYSVSQEKLVTAALRFDPDVIAIGEIRDEEASAAVEASLTGHTVVTTVHSGPAEGAHSRMSLLCQRRFELGMEVSLRQTRQAFPIVVFTHKCEDNVRRVMDISECIAHDDAPAEYRCLYRYRIDENKYENGNYTVSGAFERVNEPAAHLRILLLRAGIPWNELTRIAGHDA